MFKRERRKNEKEDKREEAIRRHTLKPFWLRGMPTQDEQLMRKVETGA